MEKILNIKKDSFINRKPFTFTLIILFVIFWFGHFTLSRSYKAGLEMTLFAGVLYSIITILFLWLGFRTENKVLQNLYGLIAGLGWWSVFGEIGDTLQADFNFTTGVGIGYGNFSFLILLGIVLIMAVRKNAIVNDTVLQWLNFAYLNWLSHVILLTVYYAPIFGGQTPEHGVVANCWEVWSKPRLTAAIIIWVIYLFVMIPLILIKFRKSQDIRVKVASAFWFLIFFWSAFVELPKKLINFLLW